MMQQVRDRPDRFFLLAVGASASIVALRREFASLTASIRSLSNDEVANTGWKEEDGALYIPSTLSGEDYRSLATSLDLGDGECKVSKSSVCTFSFHMVDTLSFLTV